MVPALLDFCAPHWIKLQRVEGLPYLDTDFDAKGLAESLAAFHLASFDGDKCLCHIDNQPRNILTTQDRFWFLDFSDSRREYPEFDLCHLFLFWASDLPGEAFAHKLESFITAYNAYLPIRKEVWGDCLSRGIVVFDQRRNQYQKPLGKNPEQVVLQNRAAMSF